MISRFDPGSEFWFDEGCHIVEIHNGGHDDGCSIARARVAPGATTEMHVLDGIVERYVILEGEGIAEVDGKRSTVAVLDVVMIPAGAPQRITNTGATDLVFLCVCTPRFTRERYRRGGGR